MVECEICYETVSGKIFLPCSHSLCKDCFDKIPDKCPFCRQPIREEPEKQKEEILLDYHPEMWLYYDENSWVTYSKFLSNGSEIIRTFKSTEVPISWRNDDMSTVIKRKRKRKNYRRYN